MTKAMKSSHRCIICYVRARRNGFMCAQCVKSYDTSSRKDDGTILAAMEWAATRARRFAKGRA